MICNNIEIVRKEQVEFLKFPKEEVLTSKTDRYERCISLKRAMVLGNLEREKVGILFYDNEGLKRLETTIWGVTDKVIILKKSTIIPLERILKVS